MTEGEETDDRARVGTSGDVQTDVNAYFDSTALYWDRVYRGDGVQAQIYRARQGVVVEFFEAAHLARGARVLEIGCGAGHLTVLLASKGVRVDAVDASQAMVDVTSARVREAGLQESVSVDVADVHALPFTAGRFDAVVAVGVLPWLHSPDTALTEMARVLSAQGQLIMTADNRLRLTSFTDPRRVLGASPLKRVYRMLRKGEGDSPARSRLDSPRAVDRRLGGAGLRPVERRTVGFGPFSLLGRAILEGSVGVRLSERLQALADRGVPGLRWTGWHYVVRAARL
jgi:ubiquinone/menaquinone biosynthesis C-methylase UbiE